MALQCSAGNVEKASRSSAASASIKAASSKRPVSWSTTRACWSQTLSWSGCSKIVRTKVATMPWDAFGSRVNRFRAKWTLCGCLHNVHFAWNLLATVPKSQQEMVAAAFRTVFAYSSREE